MNHQYPTLYKKFSVLVVLCLAPLFFQCSSKPVQEEVPVQGELPSDDETIPEQYGPFHSKEQDDSSQVSKPAETFEDRLKAEGVVLVLGPGLARTIAFAGALREFEQRKIPIRAIVAVEFSSVIAGIWASSNSNHLDWQLHQFQQKMFFDFPFLRVGNALAKGEKLQQFLKKGIKAKTLEEMRVPLLIVSSAVGSQQPIVESKGSAMDIIYGATRFPSLMKSHDWEGEKRISAHLENPYLASAARDLGRGKVVCLDALGQGYKGTEQGEDDLNVRVRTLMRPAVTLAQNQLKDCDEVISIGVETIDYLDFQKKADLIYQGKNAVQNWMRKRL